MSTTHTPVTPDEMTDLLRDPGARRMSDADAADVTRRLAHDLATLRGLVREFEVASKGHKATTAAAIADRMFAAVK